VAIRTEVLLVQTRYRRMRVIILSDVSIQVADDQRMLCCDAVGWVTMGTWPVKTCSSYLTPWFCQEKNVV